MELENLRRHWQQPAPASAALDAAALAQLLAAGSRTPVAYMRRNIWLEIKMVMLGLAICLAVGALSGDRYYLLAAGWLALLAGLSGWYFWRKLRVLRTFDDATGQPVREQLAQQLQSLRGLLRLYHQATRWLLPASLAVALAFVGGRFVLRLPAAEMRGAWLVLGLGALATGILAYFGTRRFTQEYVQKLYGQHINRLEAALRELRVVGD